MLCGHHYTYINYLHVHRRKRGNMRNEKLTQQGVLESGMTVTIIVTSHID